VDVNGRKNNQNNKPRNQIMKVKPLKKKLYTKAKELGVKNIILQFSGGSDEGNLNVELEPEWNQEFANEVEDWAWEVYSYNGAGDGSDYGDNIDYDIKNGKVTTSEWFTSYQTNENEAENLKIAD
jgi:hypothetical protein